MKTFSIYRRARGKAESPNNYTLRRELVVNAKTLLDDYRTRTYKLEKVEFVPPQMGKKGFGKFIVTER